MNNPRLLKGLLFAALMSTGMVMSAQSRVFTLEEIFASAEQNSLQLQPSLSAVTEAEQELRVSHADYLPDISADLSVSYIGDGFTTRRNLTDIHKAPIPHFGNALTLSVTQPVYTGGALTAAAEMAELKLTSARYASELKRDNLRIRLTGLYLDIYKYVNLREVTAQNIALARITLAQMQARYEQGVALSNDITRYELLLANLELRLEKITNFLNILNTDLVTIAALPEGTIVEPDSTLLDRALPGRTEADWRDEASLNSPVIKLYETGLSLARKAESLTHAEERPKIGLRAAWTIDGPILVEVPPINRNLSYWYVGLGISYNISSLFKTNKAMARSRAATTHAADNLAALREDVDLAVHSDYISYQEACSELLTQEKSVELARRNYAIVATRFDADMALITDMLDAANAKLDAEVEMVNSRINTIYLYYKLLFTTGTI